MKVQITLDGGIGYGTPIIFHSEVLADPLSDQARYVAELSKKRGRTEADELELSRREWIGAMYYDNELGPVLPTWNIVRSIQDGARMTKHGKAVERGVFPEVEAVALEYDGPRDRESLWKTGQFSIRKGVKLSGRRIQRTRPIFQNWKATASIVIDPNVIDFETFEQVCRAAGRYHGIGDFRTGRYGRYVPTVVLLDPETDLMEVMDAKTKDRDRKTTDILIGAAANATADHLVKNGRNGNGKVAV